MSKLTGESLKRESWFDIALAFGILFSGTGLLLLALLVILRGNSLKLSDLATWIQAGVAIILIFTTIVSIKKADIQAKAAREQVDENKRQAAEQARPRIVVHPSSVNDSVAYKIVNLSYFPIYIEKIEIYRQGKMYAGGFNPDKDTLLMAESTIFRIFSSFTASVMSQKYTQSNSLSAEEIYQDLVGAMPDEFHIHYRYGGMPDVKEVAAYKMKIDIKKPVYLAALRFIYTNEKMERPSPMR